MPDELVAPGASGVVESVALTAPAIAKAPGVGGPGADVTCGCVDGAVVAVVVVVVVVPPGAVVVVGDPANVIGAAILKSLPCVATSAIAMKQSKLPPTMHVRLFAPMPPVRTVYGVVALSFAAGTRMVWAPTLSAP